MLLETVRNYWLPIAVASSIESKPKQFRLLGDTIVVYRGDDGLVALSDRCAHRGAALSNGSIIDGNLTCPYHGWQYDRSGACVFIPSLMPGANIPPSAKIMTYEVKEAYGLLWVCTAPLHSSLPDWPDDAWNRPDFKVFCTGQYHWNANAARVIENALDFSHFNFAHKGITELADGPVIKPHTVDADDDKLTMTYDDGHISREYTLHFPFVFHNRKRVTRMNQSATWSSSAKSKIGDITTVSLIASPVSDVETMFFGFVSRNHSLEISDEEFVGTGFDQVLEQDRAIVESQMPKVIPEDPRAELYVRNADLATIAYRRMFKTALSRVSARRSVLATEAAH